MDHTLVAEALADAITTHLLDSGIDVTADQITVRADDDLWQAQATVAGVPLDLRTVTAADGTDDLDWLVGPTDAPDGPDRPLHDLPALLLTCLVDRISEQDEIIDQINHDLAMAMVKAGD